MGPDGNIKMCCRTDFGIIEKSTNVETLDQIINSDVQKKTRLAMLNDELPEWCVKCKSVEDIGGFSHRHSALQLYENDTDWMTTVSSTDDTGNVPHDTFKIKRLEIHPLNNCNLACRMCKPTFSSILASEYKKHSIDYVHPDVDANLKVFDMVLSAYGQNLTQLNFAGGEPLISPTMWNVIDEVVKNNNEIAIYINTNGTTLGYKDKSIFEYLDKTTGFVNLSFSIDGIGKKVEYIRHGADYSTLVNNLKQYVDYFKKHKSRNLCASIAVSAYNAMYLDELCAELEELGLKSFHVVPVWGPLHLSPSVLPRSLNNQIAGQKFFNNPKMKYTASIIHLINTPVNLELRRHFIEFTEQRDRMRNESFKDVFPELAEYIYNPRYLTDESF
jgi:sulfatase maturation enzyme AslB (radical SAM superfamily)